MTASCDGKAPVAVAVNRDFSPMLVNPQQSDSRNVVEIDDQTVRKHGTHDGSFDVEYDRLVPLAVDEVGESRWSEGDR